MAGIKPGREYDSEITFFESDGTHMQSAGVAYLIYEKVKNAAIMKKPENNNNLYNN